MPKMIENAREKIIDECRNTLLTHSYKDLNIREVAKNCGIGTGTFYNYFSSKKDLVVEVFANDWLQTIALVDSIKFSDDTIYDKLSEIYTSMKSFVNRYLSVFYEMSSIEGHNKSQHDSYQEIFPKIQELILFEKEKGNITSTLPPKKLTELIISNLMYMSQNNYLTFDEFYNSLII